MLPIIQRGPSEQAGRILVVDDEVELAKALCETLTRQGYEVNCLTSGRAALDEIQKGGYDILLADMMMPDLDGITVLKEALEIDPNLGGIIMTGQGTVQTAVEAMKNGALDYVLKPFKLNTIVAVITRAMEFRRLRLENSQLWGMINLYELGQVVAATLDLDQILQKTAEAALLECQADEVSILLASEDEDELTLVVPMGGERQHLAGIKVPIEGTISGWVVRHLEPLNLQGEVRDQRFQPTHPNPKSVSAISMPMVVGSKVVGVINVNKIQRQTPLLEGHIKRLRLLVSIAASAIENARLYREVQAELESRKQRERELEVMVDVSASLRNAVSQDEMLPTILDQVTRLLGSKSAAIGLIDPQTGEVEVIQGLGSWSTCAGQRIRRGEGLAGQAIQAGQTLQTRAGDLKEQNPALEAMEDSWGVACAPLNTQQTILGVIWCAREHSFSEPELRLLAALADIAASAVQRAGLVEQTEQHLQRLTALRKIDLAISSSLDLRLTLDIILEQVSIQLGVHAAAILLLNQPSQAFEYAAGQGFKTDWLEKAHFVVGTGYAGLAALDRRTVQVHDLSQVDADPLRDQLIELEGLHSCFATPLITKGEIEGVLLVFHRSKFTPDHEWLEFFEALAGQAAIAIDSARLFDNLQRSNQQLLMAYNSTIEGWSRALDLRDKETEGHTQRVTETSLRLARAMGVYDEEDLVHFRRGALLHDIGKMGVPDQILHKPGDLNDEEWQVMRKHPEYAYQLLSPISYLRKALDIPYYHHERWDGDGYPHGLKREQIPLAARIFSVVDVWDALKSDRPYRPGWSDEQVIDYIRQRSGTHFDPEVVEVFLSTV